MAEFITQTLVMAVQAVDAEIRNIKRSVAGDVPSWSRTPRNCSCPIARRQQN